MTGMLKSTREQVGKGSGDRIEAVGLERWRGTNRNEYRPWITGAKKEETRVLKKGISCFSQLR
jgi:hypothetical protein